MTLSTVLLNGKIIFLIFIFLVIQIYLVSWIKLLNDKGYYFIRHTNTLSNYRVYLLSFLIILPFLNVLRNDTEFGILWFQIGVIEFWNMILALISVLIIYGLQKSFLVFRKVKEGLQINDFKPRLDAHRFLYVCLVIPIIEEIIFRGVLLPAQYQLFGIFGAIIINGLLFGIIHFNINNFIPSALAGMIFSLVTVRSDGLFIAIFVHCVYNFMTVINLKSISIKSPALKNFRI